MGGRFLCLAGTKSVVPSVVYGGGTRACDFGVLCCGGWALSVDGFSTTDSVGIVTGADGVCCAHHSAAHIRQFLRASSLLFNVSIYIGWDSYLLGRIGVKSFMCLSTK